LSSGKKIFIELLEFQKEKDFRFIMGAKGRARFLESKLSLYPTFFLNDSSGKDMVT
jgi:hypothetical protein